VIRPGAVDRESRDIGSVAATGAALKVD